MAFLSKLHGFVTLSAPAMALVIWTGAVAADSVKETASPRSLQAIELYKSISRNLAAKQPSSTERSSRATSSEALRPLRAPANDNFANAIALQGQSGRVTGNNIDATSEPGEPNHTAIANDQPAMGSSSVWYTLTVNQSVVVRLDTFDLDLDDLDTVLAVYTGNSVDDLDPVASSDDVAPGVLQSQVSFPAAAGTTYQIAVDGFQGAQGGFALNFAQIDPSPNDDFDDAIALDSRRGSVDGNNINATVEPGEPSHAGVGGVGSVWYSLTPNRSGVTTLGVLTNEFVPVLAVYRGDSVNALDEVANTPFGSLAFFAEQGVTYRIAVDADASFPELPAGIFTLNFERTNQTPSPNDEFSDAIAIDEARRGRLVGNNIGATVEPGEPNPTGFGGDGSLWYAFTPDRTGVTTLDLAVGGFFPLVAVYEGDSVDALQPVAVARTDIFPVPTLGFFAEEGATYRIAVDGATPPLEDAFALTFVQTGLPRQPNDNFEDAIALTGRRDSVSGHNLTATAELGEPPHDGISAASSLWYTFTPSRTGVVVMDTFGSSPAPDTGLPFDTVLAVYTGDDLGNLVLVAQNDDITNRDLQSEVIFLAERDVTYRVAVDGFSGARALGLSSTGVLRLNFRRTNGQSPPNDAFANATVLRGERGIVGSFNQGASAEPGEPDHLGVSGPSRSVWFRWRAPFSDDATFTTAGSTFDTVVAVYQGDTVSELVEIASNDDAVLPDRNATPIPESLVAFAAQEGEIYRIAVDGFSGDQGSITLAFTRGEAAVKPQVISKAGTSNVRPSPTQ
jgi:hypothetical protein